MNRRWLPATILLMGLVYIFGIDWILFKLIPMWLILIYAYLQTPSLKQKYVLFALLGLFFCMLGDGLLHWFVVGLTAFLIGHLFYSAAFITKWHFSWLRLVAIVPIAAYALFMAFRLYYALIDQGNEALLVPVFLYVAVISCMGWFAFMTGNSWAIIGAVLFIISDSILSWNKFVSPIAHSGIWIMTTYYAAQFFIARSVRDANPNDYKFERELTL